MAVFAKKKAKDTIQYDPTPNINGLLDWENVVATLPKEALLIMSGRHQWFLSNGKGVQDVGSDNKLDVKFTAQHAIFTLHKNGVVAHHDEPIAAERTARVIVNRHNLFQIPLIDGRTLLIKF
jgi:hypothetical protein